MSVQTLIRSSSTASARIRTSPGISLAGPFALLLAMPGCSSSNSSDPIPAASHSETAAGAAEPSAQAIQAAEKAVRAEPKVKDLLYQPGQAVEWQVGVLDDGTSRVGYANYICEVLGEHGALKPTTHVRIVDIAKVSEGTDFRSASLGHVSCADQQVYTP